MRRERVHKQPHEEVVLQKAATERPAARQAPSIVQLQRYIGNSGVQRLLHPAVQRDTEDQMGGAGGGISGLIDKIVAGLGGRQGVPTGFGEFSPAPGQQGIGEGPPTGFGDFDGSQVPTGAEQHVAGDGSVKPGGNEWFEGGGW